jgi:hypothetical protein
VQVVRTVVAADPAVRANLLSALAGPGAPAGIISCFERNDVVTVGFDDEITRAEVIDDLITIETHFVPTAESDPFDDEEAVHFLERHEVGLE